MPLYNLTEFGDGTGRGRFDLEYNASNRGVLRVVCDNRTASNAEGTVVRLSDQDTQRQVFEPNPAGQPTVINVPQGWADLTVNAEGELIAPVTASLAFPVP